MCLNILSKFPSSSIAQSTCLVKSKNLVYCVFTVHSVYSALLLFILLQLHNSYVSVVPVVCVCVCVCVCARVREREREREFGDDCH